MSDVAIRVENLGKQYRIGASRSTYRTLRESFTETLRAPLRRLSERQSAIGNSRSAEIWALKDVSFEVKRGEVVGVIGRNGAGKSTLLKILSRITEPTEGRVTIQGRVGSLLEVGTGFHPELTGRENILLSGAILGMKRVDIEQKFDEIVAFAEIEQFIDTPVKRYSTGMYLRLAFAVAAHLEPHILLVDEVLAVGDAAFQKKCLAKMDEVAGAGLTVVLVSHNMASIAALCGRVLLLQSGRSVLFDSGARVIRRYLDERAAVSDGTVDLGRHPKRITPPASAIFQRLRLLNQKDSVTACFEMGETIKFELLLDTHERVLNGPMISLTIEKQGVRICVLSTHHMLNSPLRLSGRSMVYCHWDTGALSPGIYSVARLGLKSVSGGDRLDVIEEPASFEIVSRDVYKTGKLAADGALLVPCGSWELGDSSPAT
jgi:homopolymeric O-antigen transport system ATP-binding protein